MMKEIKDENLMIRLTSKLKEEVRTNADKLNISMAALVIIAIIEKLNRLQGKGE